MQPAAGSEADALIGAIAGTVAVLIVLADAVILSLAVLSRGRERPLLARTWSVAHILLVLQAVIALAIFTQLTALQLLPPGVRVYARDDTPPLLVYAVILPALLVQSLAMSASDLGLTFEPGTVRLVALGVLAALALLPVVELLEVLSRRWLFDWSTLPHQAALKELAHKANAFSLLEGVRGQWPAVVLLGLIIGVLGPIGEEIFFRGFAYRILKQRFGMAAGMALSALLFAILHANPTGIVPIYLVGLVLAWLYERTGTLAAPIGLHCANNLIGFAVYLWNPEFSLWERVIPR
jgi:uncharacterized protein